MPAMTDESQKAPYLVTAEKDVKLKAVLHDLVERITPERKWVKIEGAGGLSLHLDLEVQQPGENWRGLARTDGGWEKVTLRLEDGLGEVLTSASSPIHAAGLAEQAETMRLLRRALVDKIVEGSEDYLALEAILGIREARARTDVRKLQEALVRLPEAKKDLADAEAASNWLFDVLEAEPPGL